MNKGAAVGVIVLAVIIVAGAYILMQGQSAYGSNPNLAVISLTDPPHVPNGTTSLMVSYSAVQAHIVNSSSSGWVDIQGNGSVDLLSLINVSQIIANSNIAANSTINMVRFAVTSANITINNVTSNVTVPSGMITANVSNSGNSTQILVDLSPSIVAIYTNSSTIFVLVPSVRAVAFAGHRNQFRIGTRTQLNASEQEQIRSPANVSITNETVMSSGNVSTVSVTVKNNGNQSMVIKHITFNGNMQVLVKPFESVNTSTDVNSTDHSNETNSTVNATGYNLQTNHQRRPQPMDILGNALGGGSQGGRSNNSGDMGNYGINTSAIRVVNNSIVINGNIFTGNISSFNRTIHVIEGHVVRVGDMLVNGSSILSGNVTINSSILRLGNTVRINNGEIEVDGRNTGVRISGQGLQQAANVESDIRARVNTFATLGVEVHDLKTVTFSVSSNGTLVLPMSEKFAEGNSGYTLAPGASATFTYSGIMSAGESHVVISFVPGSNYTVYLQGEEGANARASVTAS